MKGLCTHRVIRPQTSSSDLGQTKKRRRPRVRKDAGSSQVLLLKIWLSEEQQSSHYCYLPNTRPRRALGGARSTCPRGVRPDRQTTAAWRRNPGWSPQRSLTTGRAARSYFLIGAKICVRREGVRLAELLRPELLLLRS